MRIFRFNRDMGRHIAQHDSTFTMSRLAHTATLHVGCMYLGAGDRVGYHAAETYQLFIVVEGDGWVEGADRQRIAIAAGEAAFWAPGESHGAGTEARMTAIVVEGDALGGDPNAIGPVEPAR